MRQNIKETLEYLENPPADDVEELLYSGLVVEHTDDPAFVPALLLDMAESIAAGMAAMIRIQEEQLETLQYSSKQQSKLISDVGRLCDHAQNSAYWSEITANELQQITDQAEESRAADVTNSLTELSDCK